MARTRYQADDTQIPLRALPGAALRAVLREGYDGRALRADLLAGMVVGVIALPLAMALAVAVGVAPQHGLYTAIVAGLVIAVLGGSRTQVSGPTAAFIVILAPVYAQFGMAGLALSGALAGVMLTAMGLLRLGKLIEFIPHPVTTGFTAGIGTVIAVLQVKDLFGLVPAAGADHFVERVRTMFAAHDTASPWAMLIGFGTLLGLVVGPRLTRRVPPALIVLPLAAIAALLLERFVAGAAIETINTRFQSVIDGQVVHGIPRLPPLPILPWTLEGPAGMRFDLSFDTIRLLMPGALAIAMLGAIESLLSAVVADGMARTRHDPDAELLAQGIGNLVGPFFGGIPATGAIARTATNVRSGARSPVSAVVHALTILASILVLAPWLGYLPMASLAALLLLVAWNMSDARHFVHIVKVAPRSDVAVLLTCYALTVLFDMVVGVTVGIVLAAFLFMRRMAEVTQSKLTTTSHPDVPGELPPGVMVYEISGPLFFGAAQKAMGTLGVVSHGARAVILLLGNVNAMDATGLVALESALDQLGQKNVRALLCEVQKQPLELLMRAGVHKRPGVELHPDLAAALGAYTPS
jgi:SulP family sulfate permease